MITIPDLRASLLDLLREIKSADLRLIIGGGFGLFLRTEQVRKSGVRTLLSVWPESRSTNDLDLFLRPEFLINQQKLKPLSDALSRLGYRAVPGAEKYQFFKSVSAGEGTDLIKIDILTGARDRFSGTPVKTDRRRVRPNPSVGIHAHPVDEAPTLEENLLPITLSGTSSTGVEMQSEIFLPHPYSFLMMKLFAFSDRFNDEDKDFGRYHALDLYSIMAVTSEQEWNNALALRERFSRNPWVAKAGRLVADYFSSLNGMGMVRLRESRYFRPDLQLEKFMSLLGELFPIRD